MAVFANLAIDCADSESDAALLHEIYNDLSLRTKEIGSVNCNVEHIKPNRHWGQPEKVSSGAGNWHTLCVSPNGVGNGSPLPHSLIDELRPQLYESLKKGHQFRSAWFG